MCRELKATAESRAPESYVPRAVQREPCARGDSSYVLRRNDAVPRHCSPGNSAQAGKSCHICSMSRVDRALGILLRLASGRSVTTAELAGEFDVSRRTIHRDLDSPSAVTAVAFVSSTLTFCPPSACRRVRRSPSSSAWRFWGACRRDRSPRMAQPRQPRSSPPCHLTSAPRSPTQARSRPSKHRLATPSILRSAMPPAHSRIPQPKARPRPRSCSPR